MQWVGMSEEDDPLQREQMRQQEQMILLMMQEQQHQQRQQYQQALQQQQQQQQQAAQHQHAAPHQQQHQQHQHVGFVPRVRFFVRGKEFVADLDTVTYMPDSYLSWLVANNADSIRTGAPIHVDRHPRSFKRMLERMSHFRNTQFQFNRQEAKVSEENGKVDYTHRSRRAMEPSSLPIINNGSNIVTNSTFFHRSNGNRCHSPKNGFGNSLNPVGHNGLLATQNNFTGSSGQGSGSGHSTYTNLRQASSPRMDGRSAPQNSREEMATIVEDVLVDIVGLLDRCLHEECFFDKAVFILTWGTKEKTGSRVLRPYVCHLYDSTANRIVDVLRATNGNTKTGCWHEFEHQYAHANLSSEIQHWIKDGLRKLGFMCCFTDLKIDSENFLHWRLARNGVKTLDEDVALRCLVVSL